MNIFAIIIISSHARTLRRTTRVRLVSSSNDSFKSRIVTCIILPYIATLFCQNWHGARIYVSPRRERARCDGSSLPTNLLEQISFYHRFLLLYSGYTSFLAFVSSTTENFLHFQDCRGLYDMCDGCASTSIYLDHALMQNYIQTPAP